MNETFVVAICGASGTIYGLELLRSLLAYSVNICLIISSAGYHVLKHENGYVDDEDIFDYLKRNGIFMHENARLVLFEQDDFFSPPASGSFRHSGMVIAPCTMRTLGALASGNTENVILRAADVCLKEKRPLILLPREMPLSTIHLKNMYRLARVGATIIPPSPTFYSQPKTISDLVNTVIARVLDHLGIDHNLVRPWGIDRLMSVEINRSKK